MTEPHDRESDGKVRVPTFTLRIRPRIIKKLVRGLFLNLCVLALLELAAYGVVSYFWPLPDDAVPALRHPAGNNHTLPAALLRDYPEYTLPRADGLRGGVYYRSVPVSGERPLIFLGDSCTEGWPGAGGRFPALVQALLDQAGPGPDKIINCGIGGMSSGNGITYYSDFVVAQRPSRLFIFYLWNDIWLDEEGSFYYPAWANFNRDMTLTLEKSSIYLLMRVLLKAPTIDFQRLNAPPAQYRENIKTLITLCRDHDIIPTLLTAPTDLPATRLSQSALRAGKTDVIHPLAGVVARYNMILREIAQSEGVDIIDLNRDIAGATHPDILMQSDHIHYTSAGNQYIAEKIVDYLNGRCR